MNKHLLNRPKDLEDIPDPNQPVQKLTACKICGAIPKHVTRSLNTNMFYIVCPGEHSLLEPIPLRMTGMWYYSSQAIMDWFIHYGVREDEGDDKPCQT